VRTPVVLLVLAACAPVRLYEGDATEVGWIEVRGDGGLSAPAGSGEVAWDAELVGFDGKPLAKPVHRAEVRPGFHLLSIRVRRYELPWTARWSSHPALEWVETQDGVWEVGVDVRAGATHWLDWIPEWREDRPPGPPMVFRERR